MYFIIFQIEDIFFVFSISYVWNYVAWAIQTTWLPKEILKVKVLLWNDVMSDFMKMNQRINLLLTGVKKYMYMVEDICMSAIYLISFKLEFRLEVTGWNWSKELTPYRMKMKQELTYLMTGAQKYMYLVEDICMTAIWLLICFKLEFRVQVLFWQNSNHKLKEINNICWIDQNSSEHIGI